MLFLLLRGFFYFAIFFFWRSTDRAGLPPRSLAGCAVSLPLRQPARAACWDVANVTGTDQMFYSAKAFNQPLRAWRLNPNVDMKDAFLNCPIAEENKPVKP